LTLWFGSGCMFKLWALRSLKHIFKGLMTKLFVAEPLPQQPGSSAALGKLTVALTLGPDLSFSQQSRCILLHCWIIFGCGR
jgi:hypothetical protein